MKKIITYFSLFVLVFTGPLIASSGQDSGAHGPVTTLLWLVVILVAAKLATLVEKIGQPAVLGELVAGVILGNLALVGLGIFEGIKTDPYIPFLAELGVIILLFQVGLESNISQMRKVGGAASLVAVVGVVLPFVLGTWIVGPLLMPGLSSSAYLFLGAALTATSVGITARVFRDLGKIHTNEARIILSAAVLDDVLGLIILAVVSALVTVGAVGLGVISWIVAKAVLFLVGSIVVGQITAPHLGRLMSNINPGAGMKLALALIFAFLFAYFAAIIGLAPIVGAFAAGLVLDPVHFRLFKQPEICEALEKVASFDADQKREIREISSHASRKHVEELIEPIAYVLVPIFFIYTGMSVNLETMFDLRILGAALGISLVAFLGKYATGLFAGKADKQIVGVGMVPRGEVGLIFATIGRSLGVVNDEIFSIIVIMVIITTFFPPIILSYLLKKLR